MATGTLNLSPDLLNSWLFRQLRPEAAPLVRVKTIDRVVERAEPEVQEPLTVEDEAKVLAHAAREFEADFEAVTDSLNNIHGRGFEDVAEAFTQRLDALSVALEASDFESARAASTKLSLVISEMQTNIPAWTYVRGLQLLAKRCGRLGA